MKSKPLSIWCRYAALGASSRLRFLQFVPELEMRGFLVSVDSFFDDSYIAALYSGKGRSLSALFGGLFRRMMALRRLPEETPLFIEYELLPFVPWGIEKLFIGKRKYVLNFDDAVDLRYARYPFLKNKYRELIRHAAAVIVANDELFKRFSVWNSHCIKLPTVPPVSRFDGVVVPKPEKLRIGWIGTPVTYKFLQSHVGILQQMMEICPFELLAIATADLPPLPGVPTLNVQWSQAEEMKLLKSCHVGIMPLDDTPFARGKSAFKLIQYLRAGIPAIASAVGENPVVIRQGKTGFCVSDTDGWLEAWKILSVEENRLAMNEAIAAEAQKYSFSLAAKELGLVLQKNL